jgi:hypothetical protein
MVIRIAEQLFNSVLFPIFPKWSVSELEERVGANNQKNGGESLAFLEGEVSFIFPNRLHVFQSHVFVEFEHEIL